jgi:hypothetical protein
MSSHARLSACRYVSHDDDDIFTVFGLILKPGTFVVILAAPALLYPAFLNDANPQVVGNGDVVGNVTFVFDKMLSWMLPNSDWLDVRKRTGLSSVAASVAAAVTLLYRLMTIVPPSVCSNSPDTASGLKMLLLLAW